MSLWKIIISKINYSVESYNYIVLFNKALYQKHDKVMTRFYPLFPLTGSLFNQAAFICVRCTHLNIKLSKRHLLTLSPSSLFARCISLRWNEQQIERRRVRAQGRQLCPFSSTECMCSALEWVSRWEREPLINKLDASHSAGRRWRGDSPGHRDWAKTVHRR